MKKVFLFILVIVFIKTNSFGQFAFGVSPGLTFNSAYLGYKFKTNFVTYFGFQYVNLGLSSDITGQRFDYNQNKIVDYTQSYEFSGSLYVPNIGVKYFVKNISKLKAYFSLNISKPFIGGKVTSNGVTDDSFKTIIDNTSMWGGELGFGTEYFFDANFSIGGEIGLRYFQYKLTSETNNTIYNPTTGNTTNTTLKSNYYFNLSPTYTKFSLNYYF